MCNTCDTDIKPTEIPFSVTHHDGMGQFNLDKSKVELFGAAIQKNILFDIGFHVETHNKNDEICNWCPLSTRFEKWQHTFGLFGNVKCNSVPKHFSPKGLMDHFKDIGKTCFYHRFMFV